MKKILLSLFILSLISVYIFGYIFYNTRNKNNMRDKPIIEILESNNSIRKEEEILDESTTDNQEVIKDNSNDINIYDNSYNKNDKKSNTSGNINVIDKQEQIEDKKEEIETNEEPIKEELKNEENTIDINSFFYSIHHGEIEMSSRDNCLLAGEEIAFIDTVEINYYRCYEVTSTTGKILGYYLNIFCNSDNCNRYKNQIDMSKYK